MGEKDVSIWDLCSLFSLSSCALTHSPMLLSVLQIAGLEQQVQESNERLKNTEQQITDKQARLDKLVNICPIAVKDALPPL